MVVYVLDHYYLLITFLITLGYQLSFFAVAFTFKFDKLTDFAGGTNFFLLALLTLSFSTPAQDARQIVASVFVIVWAARLAGFLLFRILKTGEDKRFDGIRDKFFSFLGFWVIQIFWVWIVSLPITIINSPAIATKPTPKFGTGRDIVGVIFFVIGFFFEAVSDIQKYLSKSKGGSSEGFQSPGGLWNLTRHPNYFGEIFIWFGIWMMCLSPATSNRGISGSNKAALWASILSPITITVLLMFISGIPTQEKQKSQKSFEKDDQAYFDYVNKTSIILPIPQALYKPLPGFIKKTILLDFPFYHYDPAKDKKKNQSQDPPNP